MPLDLAWLQERFPDIGPLTHVGRGGQKLVFSGLHQDDGEIVLKLFYPNSEPERVEREIRAVQNTRSTRVPRILGVGRLQTPLGEVIWMREQRIFGQNLRDALASGILASSQALRLGLHVLEALTAAETVRIVHRDVKPDNVMVDADGNYWLLDFGIARHLDLVSLTPTMNPFGVGTVGYAPPEQFRNLKREIDGRADLFALGVTLYECIEGVNPFRVGARDTAEILHRIESQSLPPITQVIEPSGQFRQLLLAMSRMRRDHRPPSAAAALGWIRQTCANEGIV